MGQLSLVSSVSDPECRRTDMSDLRLLLRVLGALLSPSTSADDPPEERDLLRIFYKSLHEQVPNSEIAAVWKETFISC